MARKAMLKCHSCGLEIEADSAFCRGCGHAIKQDDSTDETGLLSRSSRFAEDANDALAACFEYGERFAEGEAAHDMRVTSAIILASAGYGILSDALAKNEHSDVWDYTNYKVNLSTARLFASGVPLVLANGVVTQARLSGYKSITVVGRFIQSARDDETQLLLPLFREADEEADGLLIDGKTRALVQQKTMDQIYDEAETFYGLYTNGDLDGAGRGFQYLKELNPLDAYFRTLMGALFSMQGRRREAVREYMYGYYLDPGNTRLAQNLMREFTTTNLHASAVALWSHYGAVGQRGRHEDADDEVDMLGRYAATLLASIGCVLGGLGAGDVDPDAEDLIPGLPLPDHPWLGRPEPTAGSGSALAGRKIFISYRRADGAKVAKRIHERLKANEPTTQVFLDEIVMTGGRKFTKQLRENIENADLFLLLIGSSWHSGKGRGRMNDTKDILRREISLALRKEKAVLPVLLDGADMPAAQALPEVVRPITELHAERLTLDEFEMEWGHVFAALVDLVQEKDSRDRERNAALAALESDTSADGQKRTDKVYADAVNRYLNKYLSAKSQNGEGIAEPIEWFGHWQCIGKGGGADLSMDFIIEDREGSIVTGGYEVRNSLGLVTRYTLRGEWAMVMDIEAELSLGLYVDAVLDDGTAVTWIIPFHRKVGDAFVGTDEKNGLQFSSRNVAPRSDGF